MKYAYRYSRIGGRRRVPSPREREKGSQKKKREREERGERVKYPPKFYYINFCLRVLH